MTKQLYYEDTNIGDEIPTLVKHPTTAQLVRWAGAVDDYYPIHYDKDFARGAGLPEVIAHGWLTFSFLTQLLTDWMGDKGILKKLTCQYRGMHFAGEDCVCKGKVTKKYTEDSEYYVECEIWAENAKGERTTPGSALITLPSRDRS